VITVDPPDIRHIQDIPQFLFKRTLSLLISKKHHSRWLMFSDSINYVVETAMHITAEENLPHILSPNTLITFVCV